MEEYVTVVVVGVRCSQCPLYMACTGQESAIRLDDTLAYPGERDEPLRSSTKMLWLTDYDAVNL